MPWKSFVHLYQRQPSIKSCVRCFVSVSVESVSVNYPDALAPPLIHLTGNFPDVIQQHVLMRCGPPKIFARPHKD